MGLGMLLATCGNSLISLTVCIHQDHVQLDAGHSPCVEEWGACTVGLIDTLGVYRMCLIYAILCTPVASLHRVSMNIFLLISMSEQEASLGPNAHAHEDAAKEMAEEIGMAVGQKISIRSILDQC